MTAFNEDDLIYCDIEFIARKYEQMTGYSPSSELTRTEGKRAGVAIPIFSASVQTQETRNYSISSFGMIRQIYDKLTEYPEFKVSEFRNNPTPCIAWVSGRMTVSKWVSVKNSEKEYYYFQMLSDADKLDFSLITSREYTTSGFDSLFEISPALQTNIDIPIHALLRVMYHSEKPKSLVSAPLLMLLRQSCFPGSVMSS